MRRRTKILVSVPLAVLAAVFAGLTAARIPFSSERLKHRVITTLSERLDSQVELGDLTLTLYPKPYAVGTGLAIYLHGRRDVPPLISVKRFTVEASFSGLWRKHVTRVSLDGLDIEVPPGQTPEPAPAPPDEKARPRRAGGRAADDPVHQVILDELVADNARLSILQRDSSRKVKTWAMHQLRMRSLGVNQAMPFESVLTNAIPPGEIVTKGTFGPWQVEEPAHTPLKGTFTFEHADLSVFRGIRGILSARGSFGGWLDMIDIHGETNTPDFTVNISGHPLPLNATYHAIVDGTNANTTLERIDATFLNSSLSARGGVYDIKNVDGRLVTLDIDMDNARIEDVMRLAINTNTSPMVGRLRLKTKFDLPPGHVDVVEKLRLNGQFTIEHGRFTDAVVQQKINELSRRARGKMADEATARRVDSDFTGTFAFGKGALTIHKVQFNVPGALVDLAGEYGLRRQTIAFKGNLFMDAKISQTTTGVKSLLLKLVDPLFRRDGRTVVPITVSGTRQDPSFGLDFKRVFKRDATD